MDRANANVPGESVKEYYKLNVHHPFLDNMIMELTHQLSTSLGRTRAERLMPKNLNKLSDDDVKCILQKYPMIDEFDIKIELQKWKN